VRGGSLWVWVAAALAAGCAKSGGVAPGAAPAAESAASPLDASENEPAGGGDEEVDLAHLERALLAEEARLRAAGVALSIRSQPGGEGAPAPTSAPAQERARKDEARPEPPPARGDRCARICSLKASICGLEAQICGLRDRHAEEPRYEELCGRAAVDCRAASEACDGCA